LPDASAVFIKKRAHPGFDISKKRKNEKERIKRSRRKDVLLRGAVAAGAVLGGTTVYAQGNIVYGAETQTASITGQQSESVLEETSTSASRIESLSESASGSESAALNSESEAAGSTESTSASAQSTSASDAQNTASAEDQGKSASASAVQSNNDAGSMSASASGEDSAASEKASDSTKLSEEGSSASSQSASESEAVSRAAENSASTSAVSSGQASSMASQSLSTANSEQIEQLQEIAENLPSGMKIHIAAVTEMSAKLLAFGRYENIRLYPCARESLIDGLLEKCDYYLDINHGGEIVSAVKQAFLHDELILGFRNTLHNSWYTAEENQFSDADGLCDALKRCHSDGEVLQKRLRAQKTAAMEEREEIYRKLFEE
jgi:serine-rich repeat adhesion-like glycoprotein